MRSQRRDTIYLRVEVQALWTMNAVSNTSSWEVEVVVAVLGCRGPPLESSTESLTIFWYTSHRNGVDPALMTIYLTVSLYVTNEQNMLSEGLCTTEA